MGDSLHFRGPDFATRLVKLFVLCVVGQSPAGESLGLDRQKAVLQLWPSLASERDFSEARPRPADRGREHVAADADLLPATARRRSLKAGVCVDSQASTSPGAKLLQGAVRDVPCRAQQFARGGDARTQGSRPDLRWERSYKRQIPFLCWLRLLCQPSDASCCFCYQVPQGAMSR